VTVSQTLFKLLLSSKPLRKSTAYFIQHKTTFLAAGEPAHSEFLVSFQERWLTLCSPWTPFYYSPKCTAAFLNVSDSSQVCSDLRGICCFTNRLVGWKRAVKYPFVRKDRAFIKAQCWHFVRSFELRSRENTPKSYNFRLLLSIKKHMKSARNGEVNSYRRFSTEQWQ
jgi:hypothetical protein